MTVQQWLASERDYEVGRQLYAALGANERLKGLLSSGPTHYNREAVAWELTKLARAKVEVDVPLRVDCLAELRQQLPAATFQAEVLNPEPVPPPGQGAELLAELQAARRSLYDERAGVHAQLEGAASEEECRLMALRVMALTRQLDASWETTRYVQAHGELPPAPVAAPGLDTLPPTELLRRRNNLRSQVSKLKNRPDRAPDLAAAQTDLAAVEALLTHA